MKTVIDLKPYRQFRPKDYRYMPLVAAFFPPEIINVLNAFQKIKSIYYAWRVMAILFIMLWGIKNKKSSNFFVYVFILYAIYFFSTIINGGQFPSLILAMLSTVSICLIVDISFFRNDEKALINSLVKTLEILLLINAITVFAFYRQGGLVSDVSSIRMKTGNYFLGYDNRHIYFILPYLTLSIIRDKMFYGKIKLCTILMHVLQVICVILCWSADTVVTIATFYILLFFLLYLKKPVLYNRIIILVVNLAIAFILVIMGSTVFMRNIFLEVLGKNIQNIRNGIWARYLLACREHWFLGNGYTGMEDRSATLLGSHAHNMFLDVFYISGIVGFLVFLFIIYKAIGNTDKYEGINIFPVAIFSYLIAFQATASTYAPSFYFLLSISFWISNNLASRKQSSA